MILRISRSAQHLLDGWVIGRYKEQNQELYLQARTLSITLILLSPLFIFISLITPFEYTHTLFILRLLFVLTMMGVVMIGMGMLKLVSLSTFSLLSVISSAVVFSRIEFNPYEIYLLTTIQLFILLVASLLTYQRFYAMISMSIGMIFIIIHYFFRALPLTPGGSGPDIDDYVIAVALLSIAGFLSTHIVNRRKHLLDAALTESERVQRELEEKKVLINEVHHRVKNNLNVVTSLLRLQANRLSPDVDPREILMESVGRVQSMALVHEQLYQQSTSTKIDLKRYIVSILDRIQGTYDVPYIQFEIHADDMTMDLTRAIPCGLILNELLTNCCKHAFEENSPGQVEVRLNQQQEQTSLVVRDNGIGMSEEILEDTQSLGLQLVNMLTEQLQGESWITQIDGTRVEIQFPSA